MTETQLIRLGKDWILEKPPGSVWHLVDERKPDRAVPFPNINVKVGDDRKDIMAILVKRNELLTQTDFVRQVMTYTNPKLAIIMGAGNPP